MKMAESSPKGEKTLRESKIARHKQVLLFPMFLNDLYCRQVQTRVCLGKGSVGEIVHERVKNILRKGGKACHHFLVFAVFLQKAFSSRSIQIETMFQGVKQNKKKIKV